MHLRKIIIISTITLTTLQFTAFAGERGNGSRFGKFDVFSRLRTEYVEQPIARTSQKVNDANAFAETLRLDVIYSTPVYNNFSGKFGIQAVQNVLPFLEEHYNSTTNGNTQYSQIPDPNGFRIINATLKYSGLRNTQITIGRQQFGLDNNRYIGMQNWRQNIRVFDGIFIENDAIDNLHIAYIYNTAVHSGADSLSNSHLTTNNHILNAAYTIPNIGKLVGYNYYLDFLRTPSSSATVGTFSSNNTTGVKFSGANQHDAGDISYAIEGATQVGVDLAPNYRANYYNAELGFEGKSFFYKAAFESLGGASKYGTSFKTPLSTVHNVNGWADVFATPLPIYGLNDSSILLGYKVQNFGILNNVRTSVQYRSFMGEEISDSYGWEVNWILEKQFTKQFSVMLKFAQYFADSTARTFSNKKNAWSNDTTKAWLMFQYNTENIFKFAR